MVTFPSQSIVTPTCLSCCASPSLTLLCPCSFVQPPFFPCSPSTPAPTILFTFPPSVHFFSALLALFIQLFPLRLNLILPLIPHPCSCHCLCLWHLRSSHVVLPLLSLTQCTYGLVAQRLSLRITRVDIYVGRSDSHREQPDLCSDATVENSFNLFPLGFDMFSNNTRWFSK